MIALARAAFWPDLAIVAARRVVEDLGVVHKRQVVDRHHRRACAAGWRDKIRAVQHIRPRQHHFKRQRPLLEAMVWGRQDRTPGSVRRDHQRAQVIAVLKADELIVVRHLGQCGQQLASILWYAALPVGIQARIDRNTHNAFCGRDHRRAR